MSPGSGSIEAAEFIAPLSRWVHDSKTAPRFIKYNMLRSQRGGVGVGWKPPIFVDPMEGIFVMGWVC